jgi:hypothetical protein
MQMLFQELPTGFKGKVLKYGKLTQERLGEQVNYKLELICWDKGCREREDFVGQFGFHFLQHRVWPQWDEQ